MASEFNNCLDEFDDFLQAFEDPENMSISENDIFLLATIKNQLSKIKRINQFDVAHKSGPIHLNQRKRRGSSCDSQSSVKDLRKSTSLDISYNTPELVNDRDIIRSFELTRVASQARTLEFEKLRTATINTQISMLSANHLTQHYCQVFFGSSDCVLVLEDDAGKNYSFGTPINEDVVCIPNHPENIGFAETV